MFNSVLILTVITNFENYILDNLDIFFTKFIHIFDKFNLDHFCNYFYY